MQKNEQKNDQVRLRPNFECVHWTRLVDILILPFVSKFKYNAWLSIGQWRIGVFNISLEAMFTDFIFTRDLQ